MAHKIKNGDLARAGKFQILLQSLYSKSEPLVLRTIDRLLRIRFLNDGGKPILKAISRALSFLPTAEVVTLKRTSDFIDAISALGKPELALGPCVCQKALGRRKGTYVKDLAILFGVEGAKRASTEYSDLGPEAAKELLKKLHQEGLVPAFYACLRSREWLIVICHCEKEICVPMRAHLTAGNVLSPGPDIVALVRERCTGCGKCVERCHFSANRLADGFCEVELARCYGCGLCVSTCAGEARQMVGRKDYSGPYYPVDLVSKTLAQAKA